MAREICPSSYKCDCGHQSHFCENTIREAKAASRKRRIRLGDGKPNGPIIVFHHGEMVEILCPRRDNRLAAIQPLEPGDDDSLVSDLLESNAAFRTLVATSKAGRRKPFSGNSRS